MIFRLLIIFISIILVFLSLKCFFECNEEQAYKNFAKLIIVSIIIMPSFEIIQGIPEIRPDDVILFIVMLFFIKNAHTKFKIPLIIFLLLFYGIFVIISTSFGVFQGTSYGLSDYFEIFRIIRIIIAYSLFYYIARRFDCKMLYKVAVISIFISCSIAYIQFLGTTFLSVEVGQIFTNSQLETLTYQDIFYRRIIGTFPNPNMYAIFLYIVILMNYLVILYSHNKSIRLMSIIVMLFSFMSLLLTQSRQGMITTLVAVLFASLYTFIKKEKLAISKVQISSILLLPLAILVFLIIVSPSLNSRFLTLVNISEIGSITSRLNKWEYYLDIFINNPILGIGSYKNPKINIYGSVDSELIQMLYSYGLIATVLYNTALILVLFDGLKIKKHYLNYKNISSKILGTFAVIFFLMIISVNIYSGTFYDMQLSIIIWGIAGLIGGSTLKIKKKIIY